MAATPCTVSSPTRPKLSVAVSENTYVASLTKVAVATALLADEMVTATDAQLVEALRFFAERMKLVVEPTGALAFAGAQHGSVDVRGKRVGILFGPERAGLENEDVVLANAIVTVPVNPEFASLNLAQCVLLMGYEWQRQKNEVPPEVQSFARTEFAGLYEIEKLAEHFEERLELAGFFYPEAKAPGMKVSLRNMWSRLPLTQAEVRTFHGMLRQIAYKLGEGGQRVSKRNPDQTE